jgi:hypothetical protein
MAMVVILWKSARNRTDMPASIFNSEYPTQENIRRGSLVFGMRISQRRMKIGRKKKADGAMVEPFIQDQLGPDMRSSHHQVFWEG